MMSPKPKKNIEPGLLKKSKPVFLAFAKIRKPHALRGEVSAEMLSDFPDLYPAGSEVFIGEGHKQYTISSIRKAGKSYLIAFEGLQYRDAVEKMRGLMIYVKTDSMPALEENVFFHHDLIGMQVFDDAEMLIGVVTEIITTGANDVYVIKPNEADAADILLPAIDTVIKEIDISLEKIIVHLPEWL